MAKCRVLIVEDEVLIALHLESIVGDLMDAEVLISHSVERAKKLIEQSAVDLALLDVNVTDGKTFELATLLKLRQVPFVFLTALTRNDIPDHLRDEPYIAKPIGAKKLGEYIRSVIPDTP